MSEWLPSINQQTTNVDEDVEEREPPCSVVGLHIGAATMENSMEFPQKIKNSTGL